MQINIPITICLGDGKRIWYHIDQRCELCNLDEDIGECRHQVTQRPDTLRELSLGFSESLRPK